MSADFLHMTVSIERESSKSILNSIGYHVGNPSAVGAAVRATRGRRLNNVRFDATAHDADSDGRVQDATPWERPATPRALDLPTPRGTAAPKNRQDSPPKQDSLRDLASRLRDPDGGFSYHLSSHSDATSGWAIAQSGKGISIPVDEFFDKDGEVTPDGIQLFAAYVMYFMDEFYDREGGNGEKPVIGGWHDPKNKVINLDVTLVHPKDRMTREEAIALGKKERQKSIADIDEIYQALEDGNWDRETTIDTGGDGGDLLPLETLRAYLRKVRAGETKSGIGSWASVKAIRFTRAA